jgi:hypothetical protein
MFARIVGRIGPDVVTPAYQFGIVSLASRAATSTTIGSCGVNRYDACSSASAWRISSASRTATAPRRRSSDRLVPRSAASRSSRATRSSSNCTSTSRRAIDHMVTRMPAFAHWSATAVVVNKRGVPLARGIRTQSRSIDQSRVILPESDESLKYLIKSSPNGIRTRASTLRG